ncbi:VacJ family lipoprotein [Lysobacter pythonis]|uniref:VacJ family lipoprotein n=1 Tax=Solilutibacter pythonis TaxID=2483112 RepID=A0A3M2HRE1_9GAMM|nr:VacJ family lipoprotein [Lysobacter pythonis]RMH90905.1 VacJ family lipoprotein [Lysobacter pythonis]
MRVTFRPVSAFGLSLALLLSACAGQSTHTPPPVEAPPTHAAQTSMTAEAVAVDPTQTPTEATGAFIPDGTKGTEAARTAAGQATPAPDTKPAAPTEPPARSSAEDDFNALYGHPEYDPVADPNLPPGVELPSSYDPWEPLNRRIHAFNRFVDRTIATPLARAYVTVVPRPVRLGIRNFFNNLGQPASAVNALLQGRPGDAGFAALRFLVNTTMGLGGLFDPASRMNVPYVNEDFGQTLAIWGWRRSRYLELPLFGPRTVRDAFGMVGDAPLSAVRHIEQDKVRFFVQGVQLVDIRARLFSIDSMREGVADEYALYRDAWLQRRQYQITSSLQQNQREDDGLPDYLHEPEDNPTIPADMIPIRIEP